MIYGPFTVLKPDSETPAAGAHYTTDAAYFETHADALAPYRVDPSHPLQNVMAGDDPANPVTTVALRFPDDATAQAVIAACDETPPSPPAE